MINCCIIDDEENCRTALRALLTRNHPEVQIAAEFADIESAYQFLSQPLPKPFIVFLDIQLKGGTGFDLLSQLPGFTFSVIFTTAFDQFAINAIRHSATDYLLKPIDAEELEESLSRFKQLQNTRSDTSVGIAKPFETLAVVSLSETHYIPVDDILYFKSDNNYTYVFPKVGNPILSSKNIGYYESLFQEHFFFRLHNSFIVNLKSIAKLEKGKVWEITLVNGTRLPISTRRKDDFLSKYIQSTKG
ncbi:MAG: LytTR family DNA-binding domain-containing protein [Bacteroidia bacterium]|jgi:two-component system LytT family response regulator|nr:LytTR family DNA-binding domain-containing protein [Bacteroidia bacterium]